MDWSDYMLFGMLGGVMFLAIALFTGLGVYGIATFDENLELKDEEVLQAKAKTARLETLARAAQWCLDRGKVHEIGCSKVIRSVKEDGAWIQVDGDSVGGLLR